MTALVKSTDCYRHLPESQVHRDLVYRKADPERNLAGNADKYAIDKDKVCLWFFSGGGSFVAPFLAERPEWLKCMAIYYAVMGPTLEGGKASPNKQSEAFDPIAALEPKSDWDPGLFIAEAGEDYPAFNAGLRRFVPTAIENAWRVEYWNHPSGPHAFDMLQDDERSRAIILRTVDFMGEELDGDKGSEPRLE